MVSAIRVRFLAGIAILAFLDILLPGCASVAYTPGQTAVGTLRTLGPEVRVNQEPATDGQTIRSGDRVTTGPGSSGYVYFPSGGFIQLDENTDPVFALIWEGTRCRITAFQGLNGQGYEQSNPQCPTRLELFGMQWTNRGSAEFNLKADGNQAELTIIEGRLATVGPKPQEYEAGAQITFDRSGIRSVAKLSEPELRKVTRWRIPFPSPCAEGGAGQCAAAAGPAGQCTN